MLFILLLTVYGCNKKIDYSFNIIGSDTVEELCYINLSTDILIEDNIIWSSSDENIATVTNGKVTGLNTGEVIITAKSSHYETTKKITVTPSIIDIVIIGKNTLEVGEEYTFTYELSKDTIMDVIFSSSDDSILKVENNGKATALKEGNVTIKCIVGSNERFYAGYLE